MPNMFNLDDQKLTQLAMEYDPAPILQLMSQQPTGGNLMTMPAIPGTTQGPGDSYEQILQTAGQQPTTPTQPTAPLDPIALRTLMAMQPQRLPFPAGHSPQRQNPVQMTPIGKPGVPPSLAQILGR